MTAEPVRTGFIVIRAAPGVTLPDGADGRWITRTDHMDSTGRYAEQTWAAYCTGRFEQSGGALAEIYEVPPPNWRDADAPAEPAPPGC